MDRLAPHLEPGHRRKAANRFGARAEMMAAWLLRAKGYRILARRYRNRAGEIDLIARRGSHFAFVEVKARAAFQGEVLTARQRARIARAAQGWLADAAGHGRLPEDYSASFDLIVIAPWRLPRHICAVFDSA
ncbi:MAG TPA: YraN family protein [Hyphomicrobiales bacterium]|nr:YraN family protein [Hyphomicrobiales bacterium]